MTDGRRTDVGRDGRRQRQRQRQRRRVFVTSDVVVGRRVETSLSDVVVFLRRKTRRHVFLGRRCCVFDDADMSTRFLYATLSVSLRSDRVCVTSCH